VTGTTAPATPAELMTTFAARLAGGDADGLLELYEDTAILEPRFGHVLRGHAEIRPALAELAALRPRLTYHGDLDVVVVDEIALVSNEWTLEADLPDGSARTDGGISADVLRRQADGTWRVLVDQPRGKA
jgi:ketosteroid isomerase-like protein